jgi:hypothetical protein
MRKISLIIVMAFCMSSFLPGQMMAGTNPNAVPVNSPATGSAAADAIMARLYEIKAMDLKTLKPAEKKELRTEVRTLKSQLKALTGGVYLSIGAIIIILLILLLLL